MANAWEQVDEIATDALMHMEDSLIISNLAARDVTSEFNKTPDGYAKGSKVRIKTRPDFVANEFSSAIVVQDIRESARDITIEKHFDVSVKLTAKEKRLDFESFSEQVIRPAVYRLAEKIDAYVGTKIVEAAGLYASNDLFADAADMANARKAANFQQLSPEGRFCLVNETLEAKLLGKTFFTQYNNRGQDGVISFREAMMGRAMGLNFYPTLQFPSWSLAAAGAGAGQTNNNSGANNKIGDTVLVIDQVDASTNTFPAGTRIIVAGMRRPMIVKTLANSATLTQIELVDPINEIVPDNAAVTIVATGTTSLVAHGAIFDSEALAIAMPLLDPPSDKPSMIVNNNGFSIRVVTGYDMTAKTETMSLDCLVGAKAYDHRRITLLAEY